jgi:hypothetical protein
MRSLNDLRTGRAAADHDEGAVLVMVAIMAVVLLGFGALVLDVGALYVEKRQLQNGADAAALAVAQDCANGNCQLTAGRATEYANLNAKDGTSNVDHVCGVGPGLVPCPTPVPKGATGATGWVEVATSTRTPDGGHEIDFVLAPVMDAAAGSTVHAGAIAAWGALGKADILPITFSVCEWQAMGGSIATGAFPAGTSYVYLHGIGGKNEPGVTHCTPQQSGQDLPGGFGYLQNTACVTSVIVGAWIGVETGNSFPKGCNPADWMNEEVLIAIYDVERGTGNSGEYHIAGFVGFRITGYKFNGNKDVAPTGFACPASKASNVVCMRGEFTRFTTDGGGFGGTDYGARVVKMVG